MSLSVESFVDSKNSISSVEIPSVEDVLFSNLVLLGLDAETADKKYGFTLTPDMFRAPNVKALEAVLHYLLIRVSPEAKDVRDFFAPLGVQTVSLANKKIENLFCNSICADFSRLMANCGQKTV